MRYLLVVLLFAAAAVCLAGCGSGGTVVNTVPVAHAGSSQYVSVNSTVTLNGNASSDADGDALTYDWELSSKPAGSNASLVNSTTAVSTFSPDMAGLYVATLLVYDGKAYSAASTVTITATATITNEAHSNIRPGDVISLPLNGHTLSTVVSVRSVSPMFTYQEGVDYTVDCTQGLIAIPLSSRISGAGVGTTLYVTYKYF